MSELDKLIAQGFWAVSIANYSIFVIFLAAGLVVTISALIFVFRRNARYRTLRRIGTVRKKNKGEVVLSVEDMMPWWPRLSNRGLATKIAPSVRGSINESYETMLKLGPVYESGETLKLFGWGAPDSMYGEISFSRAFIRLVEHTVPRISQQVSGLVPAPQQAKRRRANSSRSTDTTEVEMTGVKHAFGVGTEMRAAMRRHDNKTLAHKIDEEITSYLRRLHSDCPGLTNQKGRFLRAANLYERSRFHMEPMDEAEYLMASEDLNIILKECNRVGRFTGSAATKKQ